MSFFLATYGKERNDRNVAYVAPLRSSREKHKKKSCITAGLYYFKQEPITQRLCYRQLYYLFLPVVIFL